LKDLEGIVRPLKSPSKIQKSTLINGQSGNQKRFFRFMPMGFFYLLTGGDLVVWQEEHARD